MTLDLFAVADHAVLPPRGAVLSEDLAYRYLLWRTWDAARPTAAYVMLNPSTADASADDPTIRVCVGRARHLGLGGIVVANLFALRSTDPAALRDHRDPIGPLNDIAISCAIADAALVICAWGDHGRYLGRGEEVRAMLRGWGVGLLAIDRTSSGAPCHPLRKSYSLPLVPWGLSHG